MGSDAGERERIEKKILGLERAAWDMERAAEAAQALIDQPPGFHALEVGMVVCYARPFKLSRWDWQLGEEWLPQDAEGRELHDVLISLRDKWAAHTDRESGRDVERVDEESDAPTLYVPSWPAGINCSYSR